MKKRRSDFLVGIVIFAALIILFAGVVWLKGIDLSSEQVQYSVLVPQVGGLQAGDPVTVNGVKKGTIGSVALYNHEVAITFKIDAKIAFTDSSRVTVMNVGLLGERKLELTLSPAGVKHIPNTDTDTTYIHGGFDSGIAEAIGMVGDIMNDATGLLDTVKYLVNETVATPEFVAFFNRTVDRVDTIGMVAQNLLTENDDKISRLLTDVRVAGHKLRALVDSSDEAIVNIADNFEGFSDQLLVLGGRVDTVMYDLESIIAKVDSGDGTIATLINESHLTEQLEQTLSAVDSLVDVTNEKGLKLRVKVGFGKKSKRLERK